MTETLEPPTDGKSRRLAGLKKAREAKLAKKALALLPKVEDAVEALARQEMEKIRAESARKRSENEAMAETFSATGFRVTILGRPSAVVRRLRVHRLIQRTVAQALFEITGMPDFSAADMDFNLMLGPRALEIFAKHGVNVKAPLEIIIASR